MNAARPYSPQRQSELLRAKNSACPLKKLINLINKRQRRGKRQLLLFKVYHCLSLAPQQLYVLPWCELFTWFLLLVASSMPSDSSSKPRIAFHTHQNAALVQVFSFGTEHSNTFFGTLFHRLLHLAVRNFLLIFNPFFILTFLLFTFTLSNSSLSLALSLTPLKYCSYLKLKCCLERIIKRFNQCYTNTAGMSSLYCGCISRCVKDYTYTLIIRVCNKTINHLLKYLIMIY